MQYHNDADLMVFSATDLNRLRECTRANALEIDVALGRRPAPPRVPADVFARAGLRHESRVLQEYIRTHGAERVVVMDMPGRSPEERRAAADKTLAAMQSGAAVIHQAVLWWDLDPHTAFFGLADFLLRLPDGRYEVVDTKLAKTVKSKYVIQVGVYADVLERMSGVDPVDPVILLGTGERSTIALSEAAAVSEESVSDFLEVLAQRRAVMMEAPRAHQKSECGYCRFQPECRDLWRERGDLSLVAGIGAQTVAAYEKVGVTDMATLAASDEDSPPPDVSAGTWRTHVRQARMQYRAAREGHIPVEIISRNTLNRMPTPRPGDLYFDIEGYAIAPIRLEYLFGLWDGTEFTALWAHSPEEEAQMLTQFVEFVSERRTSHPDLHIYYYNHYETSALRRLAEVHGRHQREVEELCTEVMVNLMPIVKESLIAGLQGYGLKELEAIHGFTRSGEIKTAGDSVDLYDRWLYDGQDPDLLTAIAAYNLEDLQSTQALHHWLSRL